MPHRYAMGGSPSPHTTRITERISARIGSEPGTSGPNPMALFPKLKSTQINPKTRSNETTEFQRWDWEVVSLYTLTGNDPELTPLAR